jgi:hypothetical protein
MDISQRRPHRLPEPLQGRKTANPARVAASHNRSSAHRNVRPIGRSRHHTNAAANCNASAARSGYACTNRSACRRSASLGTISFHVSLRLCSASNALSFAAGGRVPDRSSRAIALRISTGVAHHTVGVKCLTWDSAHRLAVSVTQSEVSTLESQKAAGLLSALPPARQEGLA